VKHRRLKLGVFLLTTVAAALWFAYSPVDHRVGDSIQSPKPKLPGNPGESIEPLVKPETVAAKDDEIPVDVAPGLDRPSVPIVPMAPIASAINRAREAASTLDFNNYHDQITNAEAINGELAMQAYFYVKSCIGKPRTLESMDLRLQQRENFYQQQLAGHSPEDYENQLWQLEFDFNHCVGLDDIDLVRTSLDWLQIAADQSYLPAQISFYTELPDVLRRTADRLFREPEYIDMHRVKSIEYLEQALSTGHPDAYTQMATAIMDGVLYQSSPEMALAYHYAAQRSATQINIVADSSRTQIEADLSFSEIQYSRFLANDICHEYGCFGSTESEKTH